MAVWLVRAGRRGEQEQAALDNDLVTIHWNELSDLDAISNREELANLYRQSNPTASRASVAIDVGQLWAFRERMKEGDLAVLPLHVQSAIAIGRITGPYKYRTDLGSDVLHTRPVEWIRTDISRTTFAQDIVHSLGALMTVCQIRRNNAEERIRAVLAGNTDPGGPQEQEKNIDQAAAETASSEIAPGSVGYTSATIAFMKELPKRTSDAVWHTQNKQHYEHVLRDPTRRLLRRVAKNFISRLNPDMAGGTRQLSVLKKNDYGKGGYHSHYWFAFYDPSAGSKTHSSQLFFILHGTGEPCGYGFSSGPHSRQEYRQRLRDAVHGDPAAVVQYLSAAPRGTAVEIKINGNACRWTVGDWADLLRTDFAKATGGENKDAEISIFHEFPLDALVEHDQPLADEVGNYFLWAWPFFEASITGKWPGPQCTSAKPIPPVGKDAPKTANVATATAVPHPTMPIREPQPITTSVLHGTEPNMYDKITDEIKQAYYAQNFCNDGQRFVAWYLRNIHMRDMNQTKAEITDGPDDKQIDAIFVDDDASTVYVIQGKFVGADTINAEPLREVLSSWVQLKDIARLQENANQRLKQRLSEVAIALDDDYDVEFELITTGKLTDAARDDLAAFQSQLAGAEDFPASIHVVDEDELKRRYELALERENPLLKHSLQLENGTYMSMELAGTRVVLAAIALKECLKFPGIKDGTLFQKNVRQSLGLNNTVNKGIKTTIYGNANDFFFYHNGITAICHQLELCDGGLLKVKGVSVVNGCQSLNTIVSCSEKVKTLDNAYVMFRFYEIPHRDRADRISISTNSQSPVKPRDLRSNDKRVLALKKLYEQKYPQGYLTTKRGEAAPADKDKTQIVDLADLGKYMITWHSQRPNIAYSETKLFDKYFEQLFKRDYNPENIHVLSFWMGEVWKRWTKDNPLGLNESLLAMRAYAPYHHLYGISRCFCVANKMAEGVPSPAITLAKATAGNIVDQVVDMAGTCLNTALEAAANELLPVNRVFSPQNWIKTKTCLAGIGAAIQQYFAMLPAMPGGKELSQKLKSAMSMEPGHFEARWAAD